MMTKYIALATLAAALAGPAAFAQAPAPAAPPAAAPPAAAPAPIPENMPFDIPYGMNIGLDQAHKALTAAAAEAKKHNWKMSLTVVDTAGNLVAHATMDGTQYGSIAISQGKARTAALFRRPSKVFADGINGGSPATLSLLALNQGAASEGGLPIIVDGKLIGAIGVSGGTAPQDGVVAKAGLDAASAK